MDLAGISPSPQPSPVKGEGVTSHLQNIAQKNFPSPRGRGLRGGGWLKIAAAFLLALFCQPASSLFAADLEILTPRSGATIVGRNAETHLVLRQRQSREASRPLVEADGRRIEPVVVRERQGNLYLHYRLPLKPNQNTFTIHPGGLKIELRYRALRASLNPNTLGKEVYLFHQNDQLPQSCTGCHELQRNTSGESPGIKGQATCISCHKNILDKSKRQHSTTVNNQCLTCHQQYVKPWRIGFPAGKIEETCFTCHTSKEAWGKRKYVHGPMIAGGCTLCHNPHGENNRYQLWADGAVELCIACHSDKENLVLKERPVRFVHGLIHGPGCVACHDPHATDHQFLLNKPINELCVSCHYGLANIKRGHPVGGHPVAGPNERRRPGRQLSCTSCHDPHGSPYRYMLFADSMGGHVCSKCHR
jgi:predicted CXXCH cytochrome family protein